MAERMPKPGKPVEVLAYDKPWQGSTGTKWNHSNQCSGVRVIYHQTRDKEGEKK